MRLRYESMASDFDRTHSALSKEGVRMTQHINGLLATLCILTLHGCQDGASQIRGGQSEYLPGGSLTTLALVAPDDEFVVAVVYPER